MGAAAGDDLAAAGGGHARTVAMTALAHEFARLVRALHDGGSRKTLFSAKNRDLADERARFLEAAGRPVNASQGAALK
jgi:hypothetical protein